MFRFIVDRILCVFTTLLVAQSTLSQVAHHQVDRFRRFTTANGLSSNRVLCVAQDAKGFLWIGSDEGVNRFDGRDFERFFHDPSKKPHSLSGNYVRGIYAHDNLMFFATDHGISVFDVGSNEFRNGTLTDQRFNYRSSEPFNFIIPVGAYWYAGGENVLYELNSDLSFGTDLTLLMKNDGYGVRDFTLPTVDEHGNIYFPSCSGLFYFNPVSRKMKSADEQPKAAINLGLLHECHTTAPVILDAERALFFGWSSQPRVAKRSAPAAGNEPTLLGPSPDPSGWHVVFAYRMDDENIWLCTTKGLFAINPDSYSSHSVLLNATGGDEPACHHVFTDSQRNAWVASETGLYQWSPERNEFHIVSSPLPGIENVEQLSGRSGKVWATTSGTENVIVSVANNSTAPIAIPCLPNGGVSSIYALNDTEMLIGGWHGLRRYDIGSKVCSELEFIPEHLRNTHVISMLHDSHKNLWLSYGRGNGVLRYNSGTRATTHFMLGAVMEKDQRHIPIANASHMVEDTSGNVWMVRAKLDGKLVKWDHRSDRFEEVSPVNVSADTVRFNGESYSVTFGAGSVWFGVVREGLFRYHPGSNTLQQYTRLDGLPSNLIYSLEFDNDGMLWIGTSNGLSACDPATMVFTNFTTEHGLPDNSFRSSSFFDALQNRMYFNCNGSIIHFDPDRVNMQSPTPKIYLTSLIVEGQDVGIDLRSFSPDQTHFDFHFAAVDMTRAAEFQYRYRLAGLEEKWNLAAPNRTASYANIPAGTYSFQVSVKAGGTWSEPTQLYSFRIPSVFYRTWWFACLMICAIIMAVIAIFRVRLVRQRQLEAVRSRISRDLHDDIGSALSSIRILSGRKGMTGQGMTDALAKINRSSQNMLENMDDIIWAINPNNDKGEQLLIRMREFGSELLEAKQIEYSMRFDEHISGVHLTLNQKRNVYLIFKEALNNAAKHSGARQVFIGLHMDRATGIIRLEVIDDGVGFPETAHTGRNGLINMKKRAEEIGGTLKVNSEKGKGSELIFQFPV